MSKLNKKLNIIIVIEIILTMTLYYFIVGFTAVSYAVDFSIGDDIEFEGYFKDEIGNNYIQQETNTTQDNYLYLRINLKDSGYFNGKITIPDSNFEIDSNYIDENTVESIENGEVNLKQINSGNSIEVKLKINMKKPEQFDLNLLSKESTLKLTGTYVNENGKEKNIDQETKARLIYKSPYTDQEENTIQSEVVTNKICKINDSNKRMIQVLLKNNLNGNNYPVQSSQIDMEIPEGAENVEVYSRGTNLTNGKSELEFSKDNWNYNSDNRVLTINTNNDIQENENGEKIVSWKKNGADTFIVTIILPENAEIPEKIKATSNITLYDNYVQSVNTAIQNETEMNLQEEKEDFIVGSLALAENEIYKGKLYTGEDREINSTYTLDVRYSGIENNIVFGRVKNAYNQKEGDQTLSSVDAKVVTNRVEIGKDKLLNVLGDKGSITIGEVTINKDVVSSLEGLAEDQYLDVNGKAKITLKDNKITINYTEEQVNIAYTLKDTQNQGTIEITANNIIKNSEIGRNTLKQMNNMTFEWNIAKGEYFERKVTTAVVGLKETSTQVDVSLDREAFENANVNKNVKMTIVLNTNGEDKDLYKNPVIKIKMPKSVTGISAKYSLSHANGLTQKNGKNYIEDGCQVIEIPLEGEQKTYDSEYVEGATILLYSDIEVSETIENVDESIEVTYTNENATQYANEGKNTIKVTMLDNKEEIVDKADEEKVPVESLSENAKEKAEGDITTKISATVGDTSLKDNDIVQKGEKIRYKVEVTNNSNQDIQGVNIEGNVPEGTNYVERVDYFTVENPYEGYNKLEFITAKPYYINKDGKPQISNATIKSKETTELIYELEVADATNYHSVEGFATISYGESSFQTEKLTNLIEESNLKVVLRPADSNSGIISESKNSHLNFEIQVFNTSETEELSDITLDMNIGSGLEQALLLYQPTDGEEQRVTEDGELEKITIYNLKPNTFAHITLQVSIEEVESLIDSYVSAYATYNNKIYRSNAMNYQVAPSEYEEAIITQIPIPEVDLIDGDADLACEIQIKNVGSADLENLKITETPSIFVSLEKIEMDGQVLTENDYTITEDGDIEFSNVNILKGEDINIKLYLKTTDTQFERQSIPNTVVVNSGYKTLCEDSITLTTLKSDTEPNNEEKPGEGSGEEPGDNPGGTTNAPGTYQIDGQVWLDEEEDGEKSSSEATLNNITVYLADVEQNNIIQRTTTSNNGNYVFNNVPNGRYIVVFEYDTNAYETTIYQASGVDSSQNSDANEATITINGENKNVAITDTLTVSDSNIQNMDLGLIERTNFDLALKKSVNKVTVQTTKGTETHTFDENDELAKVEIASKEMDGAVIDIEYKIKVTNEGDTPGYVRNVIDYLPEGLEFNHNNNTDWVNNNGTLYNASISDQIIEPGETKEVTLILTKTMSSNSTNLVSNVAEIGEAYSTTGKPDSDSTARNNDMNEDDISTANLIISVKTGMGRNIAILIFTTIILIGTIVYLVINKRKYRKEV